MTVEDLEAGLASVSVSEAPDDWALAAYRLAVAQSETAGRPEGLEQALALLDKAARILTAGRAPVEHGRIVTAAANCHRAAGRFEKALELFVRAAELLAPRAPTLEHAAALINVGLARCEAGRPENAVEPLDRAVELIIAERGGAAACDTAGKAEGDGRLKRPAPAPSERWPADTAGGLEGSVSRSRPVSEGYGTDRLIDAADRSAEPRPLVEQAGDEAARLLGAALINRAQARQSLGRDEDLRAAVDDYQNAVEVSAASSLQAGMAAHGVGAAILELCRRGVSGWAADDAVSAFEQSLGVLGHAGFPFHHAVARHSLALAFEMRGRPGDLARALNSAHASLSVFDPRLHAMHWRTAHATLERLEAALADGDSVPGAGRLHHVARLIADTAETEREQLLRDRLLRAASLPRAAMQAELEALIAAAADLPLDGYRQVLRSLIGVLMELPDQLLGTACDLVCGVHEAHASTALLDETLDGVIDERLFGPQRVRVRDLLEAKGWVRP